MESIPPQTSRQDDGRERVPGRVQLPALSYVEIGVSDLDRSREFYSGLLELPEHTGGVTDQAGTPGRQCLLGTPDFGVVRLVEVGPGGRPSGWERDDLQCGIRHFGLKVRGIDGWVERLRAAGVEFATEPFDAFGKVRIAFFFDPDGAYLELVDGYVHHTETWTPELAEAEVAGDADWDGRPRFDHVAVTVPDVDEALGFYRDRLGFGVVGRQVRPDDPRGYLITNLRGESGTFEVFSYSVPTHARDSVGGADRLGIRAVGVRFGESGTLTVDTARDGQVVGSGDVPVHLVAEERKSA